MSSLRSPSAPNVGIRPAGFAGRNARLLLEVTARVRDRLRGPRVSAVGSPGSRTSNGPAAAADPRFRWNRSAGGIRQHYDHRQSFATKCGIWELNAAERISARNPMHKIKSDNTT
jgi:hypothetical protein